MYHLKAITIETLAVITVYENINTWFHLIARLVTFFMTLYSYASFALYACMSEISCIGFRIIGDEVRIQGPLLQNMNSTSAKHQLKKWKRNHESVCAYVNELNCSFGLVLLFEISCIFLAFVINCFYVITSITLNGKSELLLYMSILVLFKHLITLTVTCLITDKIRFEVSDSTQKYFPLTNVS